MRLLACQLRNVRLHAELNLSFAPGITLIGGANETGKSTLVEALHRTLFLRASATGTPVEALQSRLHLGAPTVELSFEARQASWVLRKRFSGSSGQVSLQSADGAIRLTGSQAEEKLASLLGVAESLGSRQANTQLPSRWAHLWVMQGTAGSDLLAAGRHHYDLDSLRSELERGGGAAVLQSDHDQTVIGRLEEAIAENLTSRGTKRHSPLWQAEQARQAAQSALDQARTRLQEYEQVGDTLAELSGQLQGLQQATLPALLERQRQLSAAIEAASRLQPAIELASQKLEPIRLRHEATGRILREGKALARANRERDQHLSRLRQSQAEASAQQQQLESDLEQRRQERSRLDGQWHCLQGQLGLVQALLEQAHNEAELLRLSRELAQRRQHHHNLGLLQQQLAALPPLDSHHLQELRTLAQQQRDARTRQEAMAAGLRLLRADQSVRLNGEALQPGEQRQLSERFILEVGEGVALEISPGGGPTLESLVQQGLQAERGLQALLQRLGVESLEQAEQLAAERSRLEQQRAGLGPAPAGEVERLEARLSDLDQRAQELRDLLAGQAEPRRQLEQQQPIPSDARDLQSLQQQLARTLHHTSTALKQADSDLQASQAALQRFLTGQQELAGELKVLEQEAERGQQQLQELVEAHGGSEVLSRQLAELAEQRQQQEQELSRLQAEQAAASRADAVAEQQSLAQRIEGSRGQIEQLIDQRGAARQRCDSISEEDPHAAVEQARVQLESAADEHRSIARLCAARLRLRQMFQQVRADHSSRYSEPLARAIDGYLRPLLPEAPAARLHYDSTNGFTGLELRRGTETYAFPELSGGMREQLAAALRLSMADVLKGAHDGCLPLLFDDAFTNSDPERVALVKAMLTTAAGRGLQIILLTCDPAAYGAFADRVVNLSDQGQQF